MISPPPTPLLLVLFIISPVLIMSSPIEQSAVMLGGHRKSFVASRNKREAVKDTEKTFVNQEDRRAFIKTHNQFRSSVSPGASDMTFMTWNSTLEGMAQTWSTHCKLEHGQPEDYPNKPTGHIGQNIWVGTGGYNPEGSVTAWDKEKDFYTYSSKTCADNKVCGHYTQVNWAESNMVGCGITYCGSWDVFKNPGWIIVCNYLKAGNLQGASMYKSGAACSQCPDTYSKCENKLCRKDPFCGSIECVGGEKLDTSTCLCECTDPELGAFCDVRPSRSSTLTASLTSILLLVAMAVLGSK